MADEIFDREYQSGRASLHDGIDALMRHVRDAIAPIFIAMRRIEWDAPWDRATARNTQG